MGKPDIEIARDSAMRPIEDVAAGLGIPEDALYRFGPHKAKISLAFIDSLTERPDGKVILVTAMTPTPAGEGKTTTTVGLGDALNRRGRKTAICLREPSLGPCFGIKGGAAGGGYAQVVPMEDINLHFTGDFHAVGAAHNLLAAMIDNHVYWGNALGFDFRRITWHRVVDMNDRALRSVVVGLGGTTNGFPHESGFDITAASEVMAVFCLSAGLQELNERLGRVIVGYTRAREPIHATDLEANGPMTVLLKDAIMPNLVQTLENNPAFIHGGPFANIAHGCNSVIATQTALKLAEFVVTEAGFGADLGAEKFFDIKCRKAGLNPDAAVIVATLRALKMHGGVARDAIQEPNMDALEKGIANLARHIRILKSFGVPAVVALNRFASDEEDELAFVADAVRPFGVAAVVSSHWADGGAGADALAEAVVRLAESGASKFAPLYDLDMTLWNKAKTVATALYGAADIIAETRVRDRFRELQANGYGRYPVCMAKTPYSFSTDPNLKGAPTGHVVPIRGVQLAGGAEFVVVLCDDIMTMPGLPRTPAAESIHVDEAGLVQGLF
jgi:formate--tetrahydrofolate ligase